MIQNLIERNIRYQDYQIQNGLSGDIKRGAIGYHKTGAEKYMSAMNAKPKSHYDDMMKRGDNPFLQITNPSKFEMPLIPISSNNTPNQIRNYLDALSYRMPRKRFGSSEFHKQPIPGRSVGGVNRQTQQNMNAKIAGIYTVQNDKYTPKLRPVVEPQLVR